jgi:hypothetical protein
MVLTGAVGVALLGAAWRSRGIRAVLHRPRAWWSRMFVVFVIVTVALFGLMIVLALTSGGGRGH